MREKCLSSGRKKWLYLACFIIYNLQVTLADEQVCHEQQLGLWTTTNPFSMDSSISLLVDTPAWPYFVIYLLDDAKDKCRLIFERNNDNIQIKPIGVNSSVTSIPSKFIQKDVETRFTFAPAGNGLQMTIAHGLERQEVNLAPLVPGSVKAIQIQSDGSKDRRGKTIVNFCGAESSGGNREGTSCPKPPPPPEAKPCPTPTPCPQSSPQNCPIPTPCPVTAVAKEPCPSPVPCIPTEPKPCPKEEPQASQPCPDKICPPVTPCPELSCLSPQPCPAKQDPGAPCPPHELDDEQQLSESPNNATSSDILSSLLNVDDPKNIIAYVLVSFSTLLLILCVALSIALCKAKAQIKEYSKAQCENIYEDKNNPWNSSVVNNAQPALATYAMGSYAVPQRNTFSDGQEVVPQNYNESGQESFSENFNWTCQDSFSESYNETGQEGAFENYTNNEHAAPESNL